MIKKCLKILKPYFITALVSMTIVTIIAYIVEINLIFTSKEKVENEIVNTKNMSSFYTIDELEKKVKQNKNDYVSLIRLAQKYNELEEYNSANIYFENALKVSERSNYALYTYSMFCIDRKLYNLALNVAEEIDLNDKKAIKYKAEIYEKIAIVLDKEGEIDGSIRAFQIACKYNTSLYSPEQFKELKEKYAQEYIKSADINIENKKVQEAILDLNNSIKIQESPQAKYKLALIYKDSDKEKAEKLISEVLEENPYLVNPFIYNGLLNDLINDAKTNAITHKINYYNKKIKTFNTKLNTIYVFKDDIKILNLHIIQNKNIIFRNKEHFLTLSINNNSIVDIQNLIMLIEVYQGNKELELKRKIFSPTAPLIKQTTEKNVKFKLPEDMFTSELVKPKDITVKIYVKKQKKAPWTLIKIQHLK